MDNKTFLQHNVTQVVCGPLYSDGVITRGELNIAGLIGLIVFYLAILIAGLVASRKLTGHWFTSNSTEHVVADRNVGMCLGILTLSATAMGGGYINGTSEYVYTPGYGLVWTQAPVLFSFGMGLSGLLFAKKMRASEYLTFVEPFERKYGYLFTVMAYVAVVMGELFWASAILSALGASLSVIIGLNHDWAIIASAVIAVLYTFTGGLGSVIYTDVLQLIFVVVGLWLCIPFAWTHEAVSSVGDTAWGHDGWLGGLYADYSLGAYIDSGLMLLLGGSAWSCLYQRVLAQKTVRSAQIMCYVSCLTCLILTIPPVLIGAIAKSTDWNATEFRHTGCIPLTSDDYKLILPYVLYYLTPFAVAIVGLSAVSAGVMSSCDSAMLSTASIFAINIYKPIRNKILLRWSKDTSGERDILWVLRVTILVAAFVATLLAITVNSIYGLFFLSGDFNYILLFPQLLAVLYIDKSNSYGAVISGLFAYAFRLTAGEPFLNFDPVVKYPWYDEAFGQQFPFRTLGMILTLVLNVVISSLADYVFNTWRLLPLKFDIFGSFTGKQGSEDIKMGECRDKVTPVTSTHV